MRDLTKVFIEQYINLITENKFEDLTKIDMETKPIPIMERGTVNRPLLTGISGIDLIYPMGDHLAVKQDGPFCCALEANE